MESDENERHATWKKTHGMQMGPQTKEEWSAQKSPGCFRMHTNTWELLKHERKTKTPGTARAVQVVPKEDKDKLDAEQHHKFRSGVGMLLHLLKHSRPELSNPIRELTRCMSGQDQTT